MSPIKSLHVWRRNVLVKLDLDLDTIADSAGIEHQVNVHGTPQLCDGLLSGPFGGVPHTTVPVRDCLGAEVMLQTVSQGAELPGHGN